MDDMKASPLEVGVLRDPRNGREKECFITSILGAFGAGTELRIHIREADQEDRRPGTPTSWVQIVFEALPQGHPFVPPMSTRPATVFVGLWPLGCLYWTTFGRAPIVQGHIDHFWDRPAASLLSEGRDLLMKRYSRGG